MKRVLTGMIYDTEKAIKICHIFEGNRGDFSHIDADLYRTKRSKAFFLAGYGGPLTRFSSKTEDGSTMGDEKIIPIETHEALLFAEKYSTPEVIEKFFHIEGAL